MTDRYHAGRVADNTPSKKRDRLAMPVVASPGTMNRDEWADEFTPEGVLREGSALPSAFAKQPHYLVFSQASTSRVEIAAWRSNARSFFALDVALAAEKTGGVALEIDAAWLEVLTSRGSEMRALLTRPCTPEDRALAQRLDTPPNETGLARLAVRCPRVWQIAEESDGDSVALAVAAVIASVELGPIVDPARRDMFGVRGARERLARS